MALTADVAGSSAPRSAPAANGSSNRAPAAQDRVETPAIVLITSTVVAAATAVVGGAPVAAALAVLALLPAAVVDLRERRLPNRLVALAGSVGLLAAALERTVGTRLDDVTIGQVVAGLAVLVGPLAVLHLISPAAMGFGDVKAGLVLGGAVGMVEPIAGLVTLTVAGGLGSVVGLVGRRRAIAFGPPLVLGAAVASAITPWVVGR